MSRLADRLSHADQLRYLREQASAVLDRTGAAAQDATDTVKANAADAGHALSNPIRQAMTYLPAILDVIASFRTRSVDAAEGAADRVVSALPRPAVLTRGTVMARVRPVLLGMALATAGYAAYRYVRRR